MVSRSRGTGCIRCYGATALSGQLQEFRFLERGAVDTAAYGAEGALEALKKETHESLNISSTSASTWYCARLMNPMALTEWKN